GLVAGAGVAPARAAHSLRLGLRPSPRRARARRHRLRQALAAHAGRDRPLFRAPRRGHLRALHLFLAELRAAVLRDRRRLAGPRRAAASLPAQGPAARGLRALSPPGARAGGRLVPANAGLRPAPITTRRRPGTSKKKEERN